MLSVMFTTNVQLAVLPFTSVAVAVTVVDPTGKLNGEVITVVPIL